MNRMDNETCGLLTKKGEFIPLKGVVVQGYIIGRSARVSLSQHFKNEESKALEAVYKFPLPENSSICGFRAEIDDKIIQGKVEERDQAFKIYDEALSRGDGGYLLDEERPNIFTLSVGNLKPGSSVTIHVDYVTLLDSYDSEVRFFLPTTISPRYIPFGMKDESGIPVDDIVNPPITLQNFYGMKISLDIQGRENIRSLESPSHPISNTFTDDSISVDLTSDTTGMDRDFILNIQYRDDFETKGYLCQADDEHFIQLDFSPNLAESDRSESSDQEIVFILDCSGSMQGSSIQEAKHALTILLRALEPGTRFNIYRFGSTFTSLFKSSEVYNSESLEIALRYVNGAEADLGGTEILSPLKAIQKNLTGDHVTNVVLLTDGEVGNEQQVIELVRSNKNKMRMFPVGIGFGPNEYFIKQLARSTGGASEMVAPNERIESKVLKLFSKISLSDTLQNLEINWNTDVLTCSIPANIYRGETASIIAKLTNKSKIPETVTILGTIGKKKYEWEVSVNKTVINNNPVPQLWARNKIQDLEGSEGYSSGSRQLLRKQTKVKQDIINISKRYGIISRETSFVAEETRYESEKSTGELVLRKVPVMLTTGWGGTRLAGYGGIVQNDYLCRAIDTLSEDESMYDAKPTFLRRPLKDTNVKKPSIKPIPATHKVSITDDGLLKILTLQEANGGFVIDDAFAKDLKMSVKAIVEISNKIQSVGNPDKFTLLSTTLILTYLMYAYKDQRRTWESLVVKSEKWLKDQITLYSPKLESMDLLDWAELYLKEKGLI